MTRRTLAPVFALASLFAAACCSRAPREPAPRPAASESAPSRSDYVVFPAERGEQVRWLGYTDAVAYWTPSARAVDELDGRLAELLRGVASDPASVDAYAAEHPDYADWMRGEIERILPRLGDYRRQYVGVVDEAGVRRILVRGFAGPAFEGGFEFADWREELAIVSDGGCWYWFAVYEPASDRLVLFRSNGYA